MPKVALVPLDDRPCNTRYPVEIGAIAGVQVLLPPRDMLGWRRDVGRFRELPDWLADVADRVDALVVSIDTLAYGGLIPSRFSREPLERIRTVIGRLAYVRAAHPDMPIYGSNAIMRISNNNIAAEEPAYWSEYGTRIFRYSQLRHLQQQGRLGDSEAGELARIEREVPAETLADYVSLRERNHAVNRAAVDLARAGVFDLLVLTQDDSNPLGLHALEQRSLRDLIAEYALDRRVLVYPGADETGSVLVMRAALALAGHGRPRFAPRYSSTKGPFIVSNYEDRPLAETLKGQVLALGGLLTDGAGEADIELFINSPGDRQGDARHPETAVDADTSGRNLPEFVDALETASAAGRLCAVADVAYSNGADVKLVRMLGAAAGGADLVGALAAYGGWNTSNNTFGTVIAHAAAWWLAGRASVTEGEATERGLAHVRFLAERFAEDWGYQAVVRRDDLYDKVEAAGFDAMELEENAVEVERWVEERMRTDVEPWLRSAFGGRSLALPGGLSTGPAAPRPSTTRRVANVRLAEMKLPWKRLFEVDLRVDVDVDGDGA